MKRTTVSSLMTVLGAACVALAPMTSSAAAAYKLVFTTQPATTVVGARLTNVVVQIRSQNNTNVPQSGTTVTLTLNKGAYLTGTTSVQTDAAGKAAFTNLTVIQAGTGNALLAAASSLIGATSSVFTVTQGKTTVRLSSSANPAAYGQSVTFTATVGAVAPAAGTPTGTVTFKDGNTTLGTGTVNGSGTATFTTTNRLTVTTHSIKGVYGGDTNFTGSTSATLSQIVSKAALTVSGIIASNKVYDATTTAKLNTNAAALVGVLAGDTVTLSTKSAKGAFGNKNIGNNKVVTVSGLTISGTSAASYSLTQPTATANITARTLTVTAKGVNKVYDATADATVTLSDNRISGDALTVSYTGAYFTNKMAGNNKLVTVEGVAISGTDSANYAPAATTISTKANITKAGLTVSGVSANDKVYDGKTTAKLNTGGAALVGVFAGDTVTLSTSGGKGVFSDKNVGNNKPVTISGLKISGADSGNYSLTQPAAQASITARTLKVTAASLARVYGAANPELTATYSGFATGETLATSGVTGSPSLVTAATNSSPVSGSPYAIIAGVGTLSAANYSFSFVNGTLSVTPACTAAAIVSSSNPACTNLNLTFTATVTAGAPCLAMPAGTVQFKSNGASLGSPVALTGGQSSLTVATASLGVGSFNITAEYSDASGNFSGSTNGLTQVVQAPPNCTLSLNTITAGACVTGSLKGTPGQTYILQASTDMIHWTAISTNVADANGIISFADPDSGNYPSRFYRSAVAQ